MELTRSELERLRPTSNNVLIKCDRASYMGSTRPSGIVLPLTPFGNSPMCEVGCWGYVIQNPSKLFYNREYPDESMAWLTDIETIAGDRVLYNYHSAYTALGKLADPVNAESNPSYITCGEDLYILLRYSDIILAKRDEELVMFNGYILCEPIGEEKLSAFKNIILPDHMRDRMSYKYAKVYKLGSRNKEYLNEAYCPDGDELKEGDVALS